MNLTDELDRENWLEILRELSDLPSIFDELDVDELQSIRGRLISALIEVEETMQSIDHLTCDDENGCVFFELSGDRRMDDHLFGVSSI